MMLRGSFSLQMAGHHDHNQSCVLVAGHTHSDDYCRGCVAVVIVFDREGVYGGWEVGL